MGSCISRTARAAISAVCYAIYSISTRILARTDSNETTNFYSNLVGAIIALFIRFPAD